MVSNLFIKYTEAPTKLYPQQQEKKESPKFMEIRNGKVIAMNKI